VTELQQLSKKLDLVLEQLAKQQALIEELREERDAYKALNKELRERCRKLELGLLGQKTERTPPDGQRRSR